MHNKNMIKPNTPKWTEQVLRAADIIRPHTDWTEKRKISLLEFSCQSVPVKYIPVLLKEAEASNKA